MTWGYWDMMRVNVNKQIHLHIMDNTYRANFVKISETARGVMGSHSYVGSWSNVGIVGYDEGKCEH